ncbi:MAG TPA: alpha/beta fold hydrolase [Acidimicrobiales bacterium]|nr:alpha/beta fold hydrolase [Acidimicrobiales bacterium]
MTTPIIPGAEAWSSTDGGPHGVLVLHGFTGNPQSMRPLAEAFARAGFQVELPLLPGHGTTVSDMISTGWPDWSATADKAYVDLAARVDKVVIAGLSMGGALTGWLGGRHPEVAGLVFINALATEPPGVRELVQSMIDAGETVMDAIGSDIAKPGVRELSYDATPLKPLASMFDAADDLAKAYSSITCPVLVCNSPQDHVVPITDSDYIAEHVQGPVERLTLQNSYHVATLDHDAELIETEAVAFAKRVTD